MEEETKIEHELDEVKEPTTEVIEVKQEQPLDEYEVAYQKLKKRNRRTAIIILTVFAVLVVGAVGYFATTYLFDGKAKGNILSDKTTITSYLVLEGEVNVDAQDNQSQTSFTLKIDAKNQLMSIDFKSDGQSGSAVIDGKTKRVYSNSGQGWEYVSLTNNLGSLGMIGDFIVPTTDNIALPAINLKALVAQSKGYLTLNKNKVTLKKETYLFDLLESFVNMDDLYQNQYFKDNGINLKDIEFIIKMIKLTDATIETNDEGIVTNLDVTLGIDAFGTKAFMNLSTKLELVDTLDIKIPTDAKEMTTPLDVPLP